MTGVAGLDTLVVWAVAITAVAGLAAVLWRAVRWAARLGRAVEQVIEDWSGTPARPGVAARPGVMQTLEDHSARLATIEHEVRPNSGSSMRDAVDRIDKAIGPPSQ